MKTYLLNVLVILTIFCSSCDPNRIYEKNQDFIFKHWHKDSIASFQFEIQDPTADYNLYYNIRNTASYPYHNLYVTYYLEDSLSRTVISELDEMFLFNAKTGKSLGKGIGDIFDHQIPVLEAYQFNAKGEYTFKVQQFMRMDSLPEILSIGLRVEKIQP